MSAVGSYLMRWDGMTWDQYQGGPVPMVKVLQEMRGTAGVQLLRADGTLVVDRAGSDVLLAHAPTGRICRRRRKVPA